jgi:hypothetical protein
MRTMATAAKGLAAVCGPVAEWHARTVWLMAAAIVAGAATVHAQEVTVEYAESTLAPAAEEMANAGVDGSVESAATLIEIAQRYGFGYGISPDEVRELLGIGYLAVRQIDCSSLDARAEAAQRLSRALTGIAWLYAAGAGLTFFAPPVAGALGFGALASGIAATAAGWLAADYRAQKSKIRCSKDGGAEWFRPAARQIQAALDPAVFRFSWQRSCGASACS